MNQLNPVEVKSLTSFFYNNVEKHGDKAAVGYKKDNAYHDISWSDLNKMVVSTAKYLLKCGIEKGDRVKIVARSEKLSVTTMGIAKADGARGDQIRVENAVSEKTVVGRVVAEGVVEVLF